ncbi:porin [Ramlibacter sp. WS9]|uniref:porin n=1 Tax=Ramlibacter sp. WS9 TaxID=1882741 RepID=UPI00114192C1|nr:porin [Ramlibacter sp. WS9]ROZ64851.1 porin [Ramlibacter sp. WS9]
MNRTKIALAGIAALAAGAACAQSSVTLYGRVDAALARGTGSVSSMTQLKSSGYNASAIGFRGVEDLGGGMSASFVLEAGLNNDDGSGQGTSTNNQPSGGSGGGGLTFNRQSTVSLAGSWGELRFGRDYTPQFRIVSIFDAFGTDGVGTTQTLMSPIGGMPTYVRASNSIAYLYNTNGWGHGSGFYGTVQHYMGENPSSAANSSDGRGTGALVGFGSGPFDVALAVSRTSYLSGDVRQNNVGGSWDFGAAKVMAHYASDSIGAVDGNGYLVGTHVPVGAGVIRASYSRYKLDSAGNPTTKKLALGYVHNLSKRTALYGTFAHVANSGGAAQSLNGAVTAPNGSSNGYEFGVRHSF